MNQQRVYRPMMKGGYGPTKLSDSDCDAFDHASPALQSLSDNYYVLVLVSSQ